MSAMSYRLQDGVALLDEEADYEEAASRGVDRRRKQRSFAVNATLAFAAVAGVAALSSYTHGSKAARSGAMSGVSMADEVKAKASSNETTKTTSAAPKKKSTKSACSSAGQNCASSKCCSDPGHQCYEKDSFWAQCRESCAPGPDPRSPDNNPWSCKKLGERTEGEPPKCAKSGEDCRDSKCCEGSGMQCYEKSDGWATCKASCEPGLDLTDTDHTPWTCEALGARTPNVAEWVWSKCAATNGDCSKSECCSVVGMQCYMKDQYYGTCRETCDPNVAETTGWSCETRGMRLPAPAPEPSIAAGKPADWVSTYCAEQGEDCRETGCCSDPGFQCYSKNETIAECKASCDAGAPDLYDVDSEVWDCEEIGPRTPGAMALRPWEARKNVSDWVAKECAEEFSENCVDSRCCKKVGDQCFAKNDGWAACMPDCTPGPRKGDESGGNWTCNVMGPKTHRAYPSLYCFSVLQPFGYEPGLMKAQIPTGHGIWACDKFDAFSIKEIVIGEVPGFGEVKTRTFVPAEVGQSKDYTAANAELFMHVWDAVGKIGTWKLADWTVKVDPDAVLLPTRLRKHLDPFTGESGYIVNCAKPFMPEGPMMFGALEAFTRQAIEMYYSKAGDCAGSLPWKIWGEDLYMGKCLEKLGMKRLNDFTIYSDGVCRGVDCTDPDAAAFHPKKDIGSWMACLEETNHPHARFTTDAPQWFKDYMKSYAR